MAIMVEPLDDALAATTIRDYACSNCWGHLLRHPVDSGWLVLCHRCGEETRGYVTKSFVELKRAENLGEAGEVNDLLTGLGIIEKPHAGKSEEQLLKELGFL